MTTVDPTPGDTEDCEGDSGRNRKESQRRDKGKENTDQYSMTSKGRVKTFSYQQGCPKSQKKIFLPHGLFGQLDSLPLGFFANLIFSAQELEKIPLKLKSVKNRAGACPPILTRRQTS